MKQCLKCSEIATTWLDGDRTKFGFCNQHRKDYIRYVESYPLVEAPGAFKRYLRMTDEEYVLWRLGQ